MSAIRFIRTIKIGSRSPILAGEAFVLKLYKRSDGVMHYWEAWSAGDKVIIHSGTIGDRGEIREVSLAAGRNPAQTITDEAKQPRKRAIGGSRAQASLESPSSMRSREWVPPATLITASK
jgi:hypothetical protein